MNDTPAALAVIALIALALGQGAIMGLMIDDTDASPSLQLSAVVGLIVLIGILLFIALNF